MQSPTSGSIKQLLTLYFRICPKWQSICFSSHVLRDSSKQFHSPLERSRRIGVTAAQNRGHRATSDSLVSSREMFPRSTQIPEARYEVKTGINRDKKDAEESQDLLCTHHLNPIEIVLHPREAEP
jgi:hypothetical protein